MRRRRRANAISATSGQAGPNDLEMLKHDLAMRARWQGLEVDDVEERAKQLLQMGARKPRFEPAPK